MSNLVNFPTSLPASRVSSSSEAPPLRWGVMGTGWIAEKFIDSVRAHSRQEVAAVGSRRQAKADEFAQRKNVNRAYGSYAELVNATDLDVIYIATPHKLHYANVLLALDAGKHVLVEKPMALNLLQAEEMVAMARRKGLFFAEALWSYFLPKFDVLKQVLMDGVIGDIKSVYTDYGEYFPPGHRIFDVSLAGGPLLDLGTYPVSLLTELLGVPVNVIGLGQQDPSGVNGQLSAILTDAAGSQGTISTTLYGFTPTNAVITGTCGSIRFESEFNMPGSFVVASADGSVQLRYEEPAGRQFEGLHFQAAEVARRISAGDLETPCRRLQSSLDTMATLDRIRHAVGIDFSAAGVE